MPSSSTRNLEIIRRNFRIACATAEISQAEIARRLNVSKTTLHLVLYGKGGSRRVMDAIRKFTDEQCRVALASIASQSPESR